MSAAINKCLVAFFSCAIFVTSVFAGDWTEFRGPGRDGISPERKLPEKWSPLGENLVWKAPFGGRSTPIVLGDRVYVQTTSGKGETLQERIVCLNADTSKKLWEYRFNIYLSDAPPHYIGWASPAADAQTGNVYALSGGATLMALSSAGKLLWERSLSEEVGFLTTHGGRIVSPIIDGDLVIISGITFAWGTQGRGQHRFMAFDKRSGECVWTSNFAGRPYDTTYAPPIIANVGGMRLLIQGTSDGSVYAIKPQTGEMVWKYEISKRGINTGVVVKDGIAYVTHSEENLASSEMGMLSAVDASAKGEIKGGQIKWSQLGWRGGFSSPVIDNDIFYQVDNSSNLAAFDLRTGKQLWTQNLGTSQTGSLVMGEGKLYVGTDDGKFFILKPGPAGCEILDQDQLGTEEKPEQIFASVAVSNGRVYLVSDSAVYAIGKRNNHEPQKKGAATISKLDDQNVTYAQVAPTELILKPGDKIKFRVRLFNDKGEFIREDKATFALEGLKGTISENGEYTASTETVAQAGQVTATVNGIKGVARVRVMPPPPYSENFDSIAVNSLPAHWANGTLKYTVREVDGNKVLVKTTEGSSLLSRARLFIGPDYFSNYTTEADIYATEKRRQMGDAGVLAQRYMLILFGNAQKLELTPWQPETARAVNVPFTWKKDTWYRIKLQVENLPNGKVRARGKVWAVGESEPEAWTIERIDPIGNRQGSPGVFGNALAEIYFDNIKVTPNSGGSGQTAVSGKKGL